jgi:hypothetical protein
MDGPSLTFIFSPFHSSCTFHAPKSSRCLATSRRGNTKSDQSPPLATPPDVTIDSLLSCCLASDCQTEPPPCAASLPLLPQAKSSTTLTNPFCWFNFLVSPSLVNQRTLMIGVTSQATTTICLLFYLIFRDDSCNSTLTEFFSVFLFLSSN